MHPETVYELQAFAWVCDLPPVSMEGRCPPPPFIRHRPFSGVFFDTAAKTRGLADVRPLRDNHPSGGAPAALPHKGPDFTARPRYNVAPSQVAPVVRLNPTSREREMVMLRWGLVPYWSDSPKPSYSTINAKAETVDRAPAYRAAFEHRRCLVVADAFYEWHGKGKSPKQPYRIAMKDDSPFALAGLWEHWHGDGETVDSFTIITGRPNCLVKPIHGRMPVILPSDSWEDWLTGEGGRQLLEPYPAEEMMAMPISPRINSPVHDDPACVEPIN